MTIDSDHVSESDDEYKLRVARMDLTELLDEVMERPEFLTDSYYRDLGEALRARYEELRRER